METTTGFWKEWWNNNAHGNTSDYEVDRGVAVPIDELEKRSLAQFLRAVDPSPTDYVLDAGCGTGVNLSRLSPLVKSIVGLDFSGEMLKRAEQRITRDGLLNVTTAVGNVLKIEYPSKHFDKVICMSVLQFLNDEEREAALREMARVCKMGGRIILHVKNRTSLYGVSRALLQFVSKLVHKRFSPDHYRPRVWYEEAIKRAGGEIIDYDSFGIITFVPLPAAVLRWLLRLEMRLIRGRWFKRYGVNYKITVRVC